MKKNFALLFFCLLPLAGYAQIVIEERVEIAPTPNILLKPLAQHTIHVDLQWTPAEIATFMSVSGDPNQYPCQNFGNSGWQTTGFIYYEQEDLTGGIYTLRVSINAPCSPPNTITAQYSVYFDGTILTNGTFELSGCFHTGSFPFVDINFETPLITDYSFNIYPASLCLGKGTTPGFALGNGCTNVEIDTTTEMVSLQILNGDEFTSFYGYQGMITDNLTIPYSELNSVELKQDQFFSGSPTTVLVQSNIGGLIKQESIVAYPKSSYGINPSTVPYPIQYGDTKYIEVTTYGPGGCSAIFPSDIKLNAVITKGNESGYLQDFDHGTTGDTLTNITFSDFGGNHIGFISDGVKKDIADTVMVTFSTTDAEISTKQVAIIINPSPLYLTIEPENLAPGDTALIIIKSRLEDGTLIDFPGWQTFEIKMIEGCNLGKILAGEDTARYFYDVPQPIKFVADSIGNGTVELIVGLVEEIIGTRPVQESEIDIIKKTAKEKQNKLNAEKTKKEINENPPLNPVAEFCPIEEIQSFTIEEFDFVVGDECDEEIVVCNNYTPPKFEDVGTITVLGENDPWQWIDDQGNPQTTNTSNGCDPIKPGEIGLTYIILTIGDPAISQQPIYYRLDDMKVTACADKSNPNPSDQVWRFGVENMRIPIFRDHCPAWAIANDYFDLLDGTNADTLAKYIKNCNDYSNVIDALAWWKKGFYYKTGPLPYKYYFSAGVIAHENIHVRQIKDGGTKAFPISSLSQVMNGPDGLPKLVEYNDLYLNVYKCPEDVLNSLTGTTGKVVKLKERIKNQLNEELKNADKLKYLGGVDGQLRWNSELEADELARPIYDEIKRNIENWAKQQSWWCIPWPIVGDDYYRGCDKSDCTP